MGSRPSPEDPRDWALHKIGVASGSIPERVNNDKLVGFVTDQSITSSCVGQGTARAWYTRALLQGDSLVKYPSPLAIYAEARAAELGQQDAPLLDQGSYPRLGLKAASALGVVPMERWADIGDINTRPPWEILRESTDSRGVRFARVESTYQMRVALAAGHPLVVAFDVDVSFEDYRGGAWTGMRGHALGGHCTCLIGYEPGKFRGVNSWGSGWGENGLYWIADMATLGMEAWAVELVTTDTPGIA